MTAIDGVEYIPQAKIASLFVVFALVIVYNKLLDVFPKHHLFYLVKPSLILRSAAAAYQFRECRRWASRTESCSQLWDFFSFIRPSAFRTL